MPARIRLARRSPNPLSGLIRLVEELSGGWLLSTVVDTGTDLGRRKAGRRELDQQSRQDGERDAHVRHSPGRS